MGVFNAVGIANEIERIYRKVTYRIKDIRVASDELRAMRIVECFGGKHAMQVVRKFVSDRYEIPSSALLRVKPDHIGWNPLCRASGKWTELYSDGRRAVIACELR
jgi:hypothetical protein